MAFSRPLLLTFTVLASTAITAEAGLSCGGLNYDTLINVYRNGDVPCADLATNVSDLLATQFICVDSFGRGGGGGFLAMEKNETSVAIALNKIAGDNPDKFGVLGDGIKHPGLEYRENDSPFFFISDQTGGSEGFYGIGVNDDAICEVVANALNMLATTPATTPAPEPEPEPEPDTSEAENDNGSGDAPGNDGTDVLSGAAETCTATAVIVAMAMPFL